MVVTGLRKTPTHARENHHDKLFATTLADKITEITMKREGPEVQTSSAKERENTSHSNL